MSRHSFSIHPGGKFNFTLCNLDKTVKRQSAYQWSNKRCVEIDKLFICILSVRYYSYLTLIKIAVDNKFKRMKLLNLFVGR